MLNLKNSRRYAVICAALLCMAIMPGAVSGGDLAEVKKTGVLRHLGIPYANFVTGSGDGMDVELIRKFADFLGVRYEYVKTDWGSVVEELIGKKVKVSGGKVEMLGETPVKGDLIANGFTVLPWRESVMDFSTPTFPSQIWLVARADSKAKPIRPRANIDQNISRTKAMMKNRSVLALKNTCLDPDLYNLSASGAQVICFKGKLNELAPAIMNGEAEMTILDVPDALVAMEKWPGKMKVIGPVSRRQEMGVAFPKSSPELRAAFNAFLKQIRENGTYDGIVKKYYPTAFASFPDFFKGR